MRTGERVETTYVESLNLKIIAEELIFRVTGRRIDGKLGKSIEDKFEVMISRVGGFEEVKGCRTETVMCRAEGG